MPFVHLHNRSQYSLLDGAWSPTALVNRAAELQMPAVALTDTCNLYGAYEFFKAAKGAGISQVVLDRSGARYHAGGKVGALAHAVREAGINF